MPRMLEDLVGKHFGRLEVVAYAGLRTVGSTKASAWKCRCCCGKEVIVFNNNLKRGNTTSCGCVHHDKVTRTRKNLTGKKFGQVVVICEHSRKDGETYWKVFCHHCKKEKVMPRASLTKSTKSCGCMRGNYKHGEWSKGMANYSQYRRQDPLVRLRHNVSCSIRSALKSKKAGKSVLQHLPYTIEQLKQYLEQQFEPWMNWDNYGGRSDCSDKTWSIDHIKPQVEFPYTSMDDPLFRECWDLSNLRPLEKLENFSKGAR